MYSYNLHVVDANGAQHITKHGSLPEALSEYDSRFKGDQPSIVFGAIVVDKPGEIGYIQGQIADHTLLLGLAEKWNNMGIKKALMNLYIEPDALKEIDVQAPQPTDKTQGVMLRTEWGTYQDTPTLAFLPGLTYKAKLAEDSRLVQREGKDVEAAFQGFNLWDAEENKPWNLDKTPAKVYTDHERLIIQKTSKAKTVEVITTCYDRV